MVAQTFEPDLLEGDKGLELLDAAQRHAVSTIFAPIDPKGKGLVVQYELQLKNGTRTHAGWVTYARVQPTVLAPSLVQVSSAVVPT